MGIAAELHPRPSRITTFTAVGLSALTADLPVAAQFVRDELGGLARDGDEASLLRRTIEVYLASGSNISRTATELNLHRNTVIYRLKKADGRIGRPIHSRALEIHAAITLLRQTGGSSSVSNGGATSEDTGRAARTGLIAGP